jgi:hypothetical protein
MQNWPPRRVDHCLARPEIGKLSPMEEGKRRLMLLLGHNEGVTATYPTAMEVWLK